MEQSALSSLRAGTMIALLLASATTRPAPAQLSIGSTSGVLPASTPTQSLILGDDLAQLRAQWQAPVNTTQQAWINNIQARANQATSGAVPASFAIAATDSSIAQAAGLRYAMSGNAADLNKAVTALLNCALPANNGNDFITQPELLTSYLSAYDFIRGASLTELPQATRSTIEARLDSLASNLSYGNFTASNALGKIGATKALAGELLGDQQLLNKGLSDLQAHYNYSTTDDGWFTDSQGHYLNYTLRHLALFARAYQQGSGVNLYPNLQPLFDMSIGMRLPDGTTPNVSNGLLEPVAMTLFTQTGNAADAGRMLWYTQSVSPQPYPFTSIGVDNNDNSYSSFFALTDFGAGARAPTVSPTYFSPGQAKVTVFRQDWGPTSDYLMLSPGIDSPPATTNFPGFEDLRLPAFHSHNDTLEVLLAARGKYLLVAPGYERTDLPHSPPGLNTQLASWHNVVLVDGATGPQDQGRMMRPDDFVHTNRLDSTELGNFKGVSDFATLRTNYGGTDVARSVAFPGEEYFVVIDRMHSTTSHSYGFNLVGRGAQTVLTNQPGVLEVKWSNEGAQVIEHLMSTQPMSLATSSIWMQTQFDTFEQTRRMTASTSAADGMFASVLETGNAGDASHLSISSLSNDPSYLAFAVGHTTAGWVDTILAQHNPALRSAGSLSSDGEYSYIRETAGILQRAMMAGGTTLMHQGQLVFQLNHAATLSILFAPGHLLGTLSDDDLVSGTHLSFYGQGRIGSALLNGSPIPYANANGVATIVVPSGGSIDVTFLPVPEPASVWLALLGGIGAGAALRRASASSWKLIDLTTRPIWPPHHQPRRIGATVNRTVGSSIDRQIGRTTMPGSAIK
jgi:hypothetical protein